MIVSKSRSNLKVVDLTTFSPHFRWKRKSDRIAPGEEIYCEGVSLADAAAKFETPAYVYSSTAITDAFRELDRGLTGVPHTLCFAMKANGNLSILKHLARLGSGFDIVSGGELEHLRRIGARGDRIVYSGVGKTREEIRAALQYPGARRRERSGILLFNVESEAEFDVLEQEAARHVDRGGTAPGLAVRVNPDILAGGHPHIATGLHEHKFGLGWNEARQLYLAHRDSKWIGWQGISAHLGSQIVSSQPFKQALKKVIGFVGELKKNGIELRYLDFGGGLGIRYTDEKVPSRGAYARMIANMVRPLGVHLLLEPGRTIIAPAGVLLTRVLYNKRNGKKTFVIVDAGMNDLMRPSLYGAVHPITRTMRNRDESGSNFERVDIVGPVCETGDCFLHDWRLGPVKTGDVLAIWAAGAYGMSLASNYNGRCRAPEILITGKKSQLIRRRETVKDLLIADVLT
ncbi:MAG TPA: diaminopimelate decarboxylase [Candidatus Acidoferrum sp.]|jgi:diaminopimelate decarboxylase|nr:diaminopimelate decarboxylase [Candidatus Acidoferrum sp.]